MTTTTALHWIELYLGETHYYAEEDSAEGYTIQWYMTDATLYIFFERLPEIDIRLEREVYMVKVNVPHHFSISRLTRTIVSRPIDIANWVNRSHCTQDITISTPNLG
jgi:hypothetical protein